MPRWFLLRRRGSARGGLPGPSRLVLQRGELVQCGRRLPAGNVLPLWRCHHAGDVRRRIRAILPERFVDVERSGVPGGLLLRVRAQLDRRHPGHVLVGLPDGRLRKLRDAGWRAGRMCGRGADVQCRR